MNMPKDIPEKSIPSFRSIDLPLRQVRRVIYQSLRTRAAQAELALFFDHLHAGGGGKMLRPGMVLLAGECFGTLTDEHIRVSAMVEMIHHATLLHDDVLDEGCKRRGIPTANHLWGNESAVLLGDFLLSQVFRMAAELDSPVAKVLAQTAAQVCEGELRQTMHRRDWQLNEAQYLAIITEKSASFFGGCCRLGAMLSQADEGQVESVARFGLLAGIAFQIADDLLDIAGDEGHVGKTLQSDLAKDKPTLAVIHLLRTLDAARQADVRALLESPDGTGRELPALLERAGSLQYAREQAAEYVGKAIEALAEVPSSPAKEALIETARFMANRGA
jgi:octaprenyl-diphosphate synthase